MNITCNVNKYIRTQIYACCVFKKYCPFSYTELLYTKDKTPWTLSTCLQNSFIQLEIMNRNYFFYIMI